MTPTSLDHLTSSLATLTWRDRLTLLWRICKTFWPRPATTPPPAIALQSNIASRTQRLLELQQIRQEENYTLEIPERRDRPSHPLQSK